VIALYAKALENVNLRGEAVMPEAREFAARARDSAEAIIALALDPDQAYHALFPYSCQPEVVDVAFSGLLYLKLSRLFPPPASPTEVVRRCFELQAFLGECQQLRYALTIRVATERFARASGVDLPAGAGAGAVGASGAMTRGPGTPAANPPEAAAGDMSVESFELPADWATELPSWLEGGGEFGLDKDWDWQTGQPQDQLFMPL